MNLLYIIPTRGRPLNLLGTVSTAWRLRSGRHEVQIALALDRDDASTMLAYEFLVGAERGDLMDHVIFSPAPRPDALGEKWNRPIGRADNWDAAILMTDRMIPITPGWDDIVARSVAKFPNRILWWRSPNDPGTCAPVVPRAWLEAMDWKPAVEAYPYWWIDTHLMELDRLVHGDNSLMMPVWYAGERKETQQLRDCAFWCRYYAALRPARVQQAKVIAEKLGVAWVDRPELVAEFANQDAARLSRAAEFEAAFGDKSEPWEGYRRIKAQAQVWMDTTGAGWPIVQATEISQRLREAGHPDYADLRPTLVPAQFALSDVDPSPGAINYVDGAA